MTDGMFQELTLADLFHLPYGFMVTQRVGFDIFKNYPNTQRWWNDISSRESWKAVLAESAEARKAMGK